MDKEIQGTLVQFDPKKAELDKLVHEFCQKVCPTDSSDVPSGEMRINLPSRAEFFEFLMRYEEIKARNYRKKPHK